MLWVNRIVGVALIAVTVPLWQVAHEYGEAARIFPRFVLGVIAVLAAIMVVRSFIPAVAPVGDGEGERSLRALVRPLVAFALMAAAGVAMPHVGFFPAMITMAVALYPLLQLGNWKAYVLVCVLLFAFIYGLFVAVLGVPLTQARLLDW